MQKAQELLHKVTGKASGHVLPTAKLGKNGPQVSRLGYGSMGLSCFYGTTKPDNERFAVLDKVYEEGCRFWDTADAYQDSEQLLAKWFKQNPGKRETIFLSTKYAFKFSDDGNMSLDTTPEYTKEAANKSLQTLGVSYIDLLYAHRVDKKTPIEKTMKALQELKHEGKIRHIGLSEISAETLRRACKVEHVDAVQIEYSPFTLDIESEQIGLLKAARELGVATVAYSPMGKGLLGGDIKHNSDLRDDDARKNMPRFSEENMPKNLQLVDTINNLAKKKNATGNQLALAWLLAQGDDIFPIPGTTTVSRVTENYDAAHIKLSKAEVQEIRDACENAVVHGARYDDAFLEDTFSDTPPLN